jgi:hypothetical protein
MWLGSPLTFIHTGMPTMMQPSPAGQIGHRQQAFHVGGVGKVDPHVVGHLGHSHAEGGGDQGVAAFASANPPGTADDRGVQDHRGDVKA